MIKVKYDQDKHEIIMKGHANYSKTAGTDAVCAGATTLIYTLAQNIKNIEELGGLEEKPILKIKAGKAHILCKPKLEYEDTVRLTYYVIASGFTVLSENHKKYIDFLVVG